MRRTVYLVLFLVLALLAGLLTLRAQRTVAVLVATRDVRAGEQLAASDLEVRRVHEDSVPSGALSTPDDALGDYVAWPLTAGEPVLGRMLRHQRSGIELTAAVSVPDGYRAIAVPVQPAGAVGGMLAPGDHVDVYATPLAGHQVVEPANAARSGTRSGAATAAGGSGAPGGGGSGAPGAGGSITPGAGGSTAAGATASSGTPSSSGAPSGSGAPSSSSDGTEILGTDLLVLQLRTDQGQPLDATADQSVHGLNFGAGKLGSVVIAVPAEDVGRFAAAASADTIYLALSVG